MAPPSTLGALGLFVVGLALAALAAQPRVIASRSKSEAEERQPAPSPSPELRRLRDGGKLDPNRASAAELELLPGIGPALAARIVEDRARHGPYRSLAELERVDGIGARRLADLAPLVAVAPVDGSTLEQPDEPEHDRELHGIAIERAR